QAARIVVGGPVRRVRQGDPLAAGEAASLNEALADETVADPEPAGLRPTLDHLRSVLTARLTTQIDGPYEGDLTVGAAHFAARYGPEHTWSPSRLEAYGACGFRFFIGSALGLEPRVPPQVGLDAAQLGTLLHSILENVYRAAAPDDVEGLIAALPAVAAPIFAAAPRKLGFRPTGLWARQQTELLDWLTATLHGLAEIADDFVPIAFEQRFSSLELDTPAGRVRIRGVIDRVDRNGAGDVRVIDYKTGAAHLDPGALIRGARLQLPLYAAAAEQELGLGRPVDGLYWAIRRGTAGGLRLAAFEFTSDGGPAQRGVSGAISLAAEHIASSVRGIRAGRFLPEPPRDGCPEYCPAAAFCWRYSPERWA
ncbi:MAG TPA: PD-(D/E)XK nuclease family protein, partial [Anaerolineales bacterium]|nr:PD-(D/E)XK nuclease family protein [Anaerolineales bacterium]